jgi:SET domain-containing protein
MLLVKTVLRMSSIHGIGLFAAAFVADGTPIWRHNPLIDIKLSEEQLRELSPAAQEQIAAYSYRQRATGLYVLCGDDARFFNHSNSPNCIDIKGEDGQGVTLAARDIQPGEELTCDYSIIDKDYIDGKYQL